MTSEMGLQEFYKGQTILLTGSTGFVGKAITEKLLRACPDIERLYILVRTKKGKNAAQRAQELFSDPIFSRMKGENPSYMSKVTVIPGDVSMSGLDISPENRKTITENVTVIFHGAATVKFDEKLKVAVNINVFGTKQVLELCKECINLKAMLHISTAYSNCNINDVKETLYVPPISGDDIINITNCLPDHILEKCTPTIISGWPNTYTFTKLIAEDIINREATKAKLPVAVFRPAIVVGAAEEPIPGWVDNIYGPNGVIAAVGAGLMRAVYADKSAKAELVPVDMVVNAALATAWDVAARNEEKSKEFQVTAYNYASSANNPITWGGFMEMTLRHGLVMPTKRAVWYYSVFVTACLPLFYLHAFLVHFLPAIIIDIGLIAAAKKPQAVKIYKKVHKFLGVISFFSTNQWYFHDENIKTLWSKLSTKDQEMFNFNIAALDWDKFFYNNILGVRLFLMQDTPDTLPAARKKMIYLYILHRTVQILFLSFLVWVLWSPITFLLNWLTSSGSTLISLSVDTPTRSTLASAVKSTTRHLVK